ncbi:MAG TPA: glycosyltransferase [Flavisolibacter sp.]
MKSGSGPLVSIVVCTYNGEAFLSQQLDSLIGQGYENLEILIADDRSTDGTVDIIRKYAERDSRIRFYINETNLGYNRNFETAFSNARGQLVAVSDQDDIWKSNKIEKMIPLLDDPQVLLAYCQSVRFTNKPPDLERYTARTLFEGNDPRKLMFFNTIAGHNILFRKRLLQFAQPFPGHVFYDWWLAITAATYGRIACTDYVYTFHRSHGSNLTLGKKDEKFQTRAKANERLHTIEQVLRLDGLSEEERSFALELHKVLLTLQEKKFSLPLFIFLTRHAPVIFFFKKRSWFSKIKMAYRLSFAK